jgi:hypothetical protein
MAYYLSSIHLAAVVSHMYRIYYCTTLTHRYKECRIFCVSSVIQLHLLEYYKIICYFYLLYEWSLYCGRWVP